MNKLKTEAEEELADALMDMVNQFFYTDKDGNLTHSFMSAEECAISVLSKYDLITEVGNNRYQLNWDNVKNISSE